MMLQTYQTKLQNHRLSPNLYAFDYLDAFAKLFGRLERKLFVCLHIHKRTVKEVKSSFSRTYGITSRQFNALKNQVDAKVKAVEEGRDYQIEELKGKMKETENTIKKKQKQKKKTFKILQTLHPSDEAFIQTSKTYKNIKFVLHQKKRKLRNLNQKLTKKLADKEEKKIRICFGSKALFYKQFHLEENNFKTHDEWKAHWQEKRSSQFLTLGSKDETFGNQTTAYDLKNNLRLRVSLAFESRYGKYITFENVTFPYGQEQLDQAKVAYQGYTKGGKPQKYFKAITYRFLTRGGNWYVFATVERETPDIQTSRIGGYIGIDFNVGFLSVCEIDRYGNPLREWTIDVPMYDRSSEQIKASLGDAIKQIMSYSLSVGKPVVYEKLDFGKKKQQLGERSKKYARMLSGFGYSAYKTMMESKGKQVGVQTIAVNPAYTSQIGHVKFMKRYGLSSHGSAACMVARKAYTWKREKPNYLSVLGFPKTFNKEKPNYKKWASLSKYVNNQYRFTDKIELLKVSH